MIFSELYSAYYNAVAAVLTAVLEGERSEKALQKIVSERAFHESTLTVIPSLKREKWQLLRSDMTTPLAHKPSMPLTILQKRWLKSISHDPRVKLFGVKFPALDGVEPLFTVEDYAIYDRYGDGDPFDDAEYIRQFQVILEALRKRTQIQFEMINRKGHTIFVRCRPVRLEYSEKDDKFRLITAGGRGVSTVNLAKIKNCVHDTGKKLSEDEARAVIYDTLTVNVLDERNAMERFMLHFAHFEKQAERLDQKHYLVKIKYARDDETEMVIRILSFGPMVEVIGSEHFRNLIVEKLKKQLNCGLK